jgi:glyoxylase-like metal-dependent hydrolase (beta-lactamase superfamily II)
MMPCDISIRLSPTSVLSGCQFALGPLETNAYVLWVPASREAVVIDPGDAPAEWLAWLRAERLNVTKIINTHGHADHIAGNATLKKKYRASVWIHVADRGLLTNPAANLSLGLGRLLVSPPADESLEAGRGFTLGAATVKVIESPGHTPGSVCLLVGDALFSGDTLFAGTVGRTDLPGGNFRDIEKSLKKLKALSPALRVFPGHGPATTLAHEIATNPFMQEGSHAEPF